MDIQKELREYMKKTREENKISFSTILKETDLNENQYMKYENGESIITKESIKRIANVMKIPRKYKLLAYDEKKSSIANNLTYMRVYTKSSQKAIAALLGIAQTTYAGYETGKHEPSIELLIRLADIYNVSIDYLVGRYEKRM